MKSRKRLVALMAAAVCALAGTAAGISQSAASKSKAHSSSTQGAPGETGGRPPGGGHGPGGPHGGEVHAVEVVLNKAGTAFINETTDSGTIKEVDSSGGSITITEGTKTLTYGTPTITIPSGATVMLDGKSSTLSALKSGNQVTVSSSSDGTTVFATDSSFKPSGMGGPGGMGGAPPAGGARSGSSSSSTE